MLFFVQNNSKTQLVDLGGQQGNNALNPSQLVLDTKLDGNNPQRDRKRKLLNLQKQTPKKIRN
jgi:hypothetical protein